MKRLLLALMGFFFVLSAQAETIDATVIPAGTATPRDHVFARWNTTSPTYQTVQEVCDAYRSTSGQNKGTCVDTIGTWSSYGAAGDCKYQPTNTTSCISSGTPQGIYGPCPAGTTVSGANCVTSAITYSCPSGQNWTLNGDKCTRPTCAADQYIDANGTCKCTSGAQTGNDGTCCPVAGSGGGAPMQWCYVDSATASTCDSAGTNGCKVRCNNVTYQKGTGSTVQIYPKMALGQNCSYTGTRGTNLGGGPLNDGELKQVAEATKDPAKAKTPEGCMAAGMGYVQSASGTTCVPSGDTGVVKKESGTNTTNDNGQQTTETKTKETTSTPTGGETKETTVKANPDGTTTTTTKTTTCKEDGTCTTSTTETTKDAAGNTTGNKTNTNQQSASEFCKANPDSDLCKGASDACKDHPERLGCMGAGEATEQPDLSTTEKGINAITPFNISSNATCPADLPLPKGMSFSFQPFCDYASAFRPIILALAWITAGFLAFGYRGNNG